MRFLNVLKEPPIIDLDFIESRKQVLADLCRKEGIELLYVYGSLAKNKMKKLSDVDIAVKKKAKLGLEEYLLIIGRLQEIFKREDIDLVDLMEAPALLRSEILKLGELIYSSNPILLAKFKYQTFREFLDTSFLRKSFSRYLRMAMGVN